MGRRLVIGALWLWSLWAAGGTLGFMLDAPIAEVLGLVLGVASMIYSLTRPSGLTRATSATASVHT